MNDLTAVLAITGGALAFVAAFIALVIGYTKISQAYEEVSLYDSRHDEPVAGRGHFECACGCGNEGACFNPEHRHYKPGNPTRG